MDIDSSRPRFVLQIQRFLQKVEAHAMGEDPEKMRASSLCLGEMIAIWELPAISAMDELIRINVTLKSVECLCIFVADIDVARVAVKMNASDTSRGVLEQLQRDILDLGDKLVGELSSTANRILKSKPIDPRKVGAMLISELRANPRTLGPIFSKIARRYAPLMPAEMRDELRAIVRESAMPGVIRVPLNPERPIYEQVLTSGALVPLTQSMNRNALFEMFKQKYDMRHDILANFAHLASALDVQIAFGSKVVQNAVEFDGRALFDLAYIKKNGLAVQPFTGLCEVVLKRFNTVRQLTASKATVPTQFISAASSQGNVLVIESLVGNLFRVCGIPGGLGMTINRDQCQFLLHGQSTRADQYHRCMEDMIIGGGRSESVQAITNIYQAAGADVALSDSLRSHLVLKLREYMREYRARSTRRIDDLFSMCIGALQDVMPTIKNRTTSIYSTSMFFARLFRLANSLSHFLEAYERDLMSGVDFPTQERIIDRIMRSAADEELFAMDETLNMAYLRQRQ